NGIADRHAYTLVDDDFVQAGDLFRKVMKDVDRANLVKNIIGHLKNARTRIQLRQAALFYKVDPVCGTRVAQGLGLDVEDVKKLAAMSQQERVQATAT
ncbi:MAG: hypothetical protein MUO63_04320, partial [Desulfobulbaceae bacterium]|nr:hypothetical protein [Desulfobulbaceae bacterium]